MENLKLVGLKSHDCHVLMQHLLPVAIRSILPKKVRYEIIRLCSFFNFIYSKVIDLTDLDIWEKEIVIILCQLQMYFPPSFFDVMVHLTVHLVMEIKLCGPVYLRNQWAFERQMKTYKGYVKNAYRPEACIAERHLYDDAMAYCNKYLKNVKMVGISESRHSGRLDGKGTIGKTQLDMSPDKLHMAHTYILHNEDEVVPYIGKHMAHLRKNRRKVAEKALTIEHNKTFSKWFKDQVMNELKDSSNSISNRLKSLAYGPHFNASFYAAYVINGCTFYTRSQDEISTMQNSGVTVEAEAMHFSSAKDKRPIYSKMQYYGVIEEICELHYFDFSVPLFGCNWVDSKSVVTDDVGCTLVNLSKIGHKEDPFVLASQVKQVFYMTDPSDKRMSVVITPRSRIAIYDVDEDVTFEEKTLTKFEDDIDDTPSMYVREDHDEEIWVEEKSIEGKSQKRRRTSKT